MTSEVKTAILTRVQSELKVPKSQFNKYGGYKYRNGEDIMQALKPLMVKYGVQLYFGKTKIDMQEHKISVILHYKDAEQAMDTELELPFSSHKGMTDEQAGGAALSYAKKYLLSNLLLIDDGGDFDSMDNRQEGRQARQHPQPRQQRQQAQASEAEKWEVMQAASKEMVNGTSLLALYRDAMHQGKGSEPSQALRAWAKANPDKSELIDKIAKTGAWK